MGFRYTFLPNTWNQTCSFGWLRDKCDIWSDWVHIEKFEIWDVLMNILQLFGTQPAFLADKRHIEKFDIWDILLIILQIIGKQPYFLAD